VGSWLPTIRRSPLAGCPPPPVRPPSGARPPTAARPYPSCHTWPPASSRIPTGSWLLTIEFSLPAGCLPPPVRLSSGARTPPAARRRPCSHRRPPTPCRLPAPGWPPALRRPCVHFGRPDPLLLTCVTRAPTVGSPPPAGYRKAFQKDVERPLCLPRWIRSRCGVWCCRRHPRAWLAWRTMLWGWLSYPSTLSECWWPFFLLPHLLGWRIQTGGQAARESSTDLGGR